MALRTILVLVAALTALPLLLFRRWDWRSRHRQPPEGWIPP
ncbi:MAG TPA: hypothetical protein VGW35_24285 [Methylomirabilota bacterium]|jgi:hypothetical protein|nr:hypothetical protein [Methylomirabilota bacterium]